MKIRIQNFGPIHDFEFDLEKDFHVIYGKNNIGKSYAISVVYLVLKRILDLHKIGNEVLTPVLNLLLVENFNFLIEEIDKNLIPYKPVSVNSELEDLLLLTFEENLVKSLENSLKNTFSDLKDLRNKYSDTQGKISIETHTLTLELEINDTGILKNIGIALKNHILLHVYDINVTTVEGSYQDSAITFYIGDYNSISTKKFLQDLKNALFESFHEIFNDFLNTVAKTNDAIFFLPASRSGLYEAMSIFSSVFARLSQLRHLINEKIEIPSLSEPVSDYFLNLSTIKQSSSTDIYHKYAQEIEQKILGATIQFNNDSKKLEYYNPENGLRLDLSATSSMVSEIAPIVAYLKFIVNEAANGEERKSKILFIEEPEAHLHPEVQLMLMDIFAKLAKDKVKIVMTTHSNYIFNKVNNLLLTGELDKEKVANYHMIHTEKGSIVAGTTEVSEEGIEDNNFVNVTERLYEERMQAFETH